MLLHRVVELLLHQDARPGIRDNEGYNAVHYAALKGHRLALEMVSSHLLHLAFPACLGECSSSFSFLGL